MILELLHRVCFRGKIYPAGTPIRILGWSGFSGERGFLWVCVADGPDIGDEILLDADFVSSHFRGDSDEC